MSTAHPDSAVYRAAKDSAAVFDLTGWTRVRLEGKDTYTFLHNFCTNDIKKLPETNGCETFLTNVKARVVGHVFAFDVGDSGEPPEVELLAVPGQEEKLLAHLDRYIIREDVKLSGRTTETSSLFVSGPDAADRIEQSDIHFGLPIKGLTPFSSGPGRIAEAGAWCYRIDLLGDPGFLLEVPRDFVDPARDRLLAAGVMSGSTAVFDALRIEAGFPFYGIDVTEDHLAPEVGRPWAISYTKGCYLGQEPIARIDALGHVNKLLRGLRLESEPVPERGAAVIADGKEIGVVTSSAMSFDGRPVALAYLRTKFAEPGTAVAVRTTDGETPATVFGPVPSAGI